ncbi:MAG TPA: hypothetical protein VHW06_06820 [Streptosporangiaceae bacterium]|jgi:hypothetical protein|nr:hypothetical protein [Streptosporangiaceae bacterium]
MSMPENDPSANTAKFQAFAQRADTEYAAPRRSAPTGRYVLIGAVVLAIIVVVVLIAAL